MEIINYVIKFFSVVVINCLNPVNMQACLPVHQWLIPEIEYGIKLKTGEIIPYQKEKDYLNKINE
jgi:hypothetical protein